MPVKQRQKICGLLFCSLLPVCNAQAEAMPSMAFLEYLGGVENVIDGQLSSPVELDLEAAQVARNNEESHSDQQTDVARDKATSDSEENGDE